MDVITLKARLRTGTGKSYTHKIRQEGWIPAVYYGHGKETKHIEINTREFAAIVRAKKTTHLIDLNLPDEKDLTSVIKEIQKHVLIDNLFYHIDFQLVAMDKKITVQCPIQILGTAIGVKEDAGILGHPKRTLTIECFPRDIPEHINIDVSDLQMGQSIHVKDLEIPDVVIKDSPEDVLAVVVHPQVVVEEVPAPEKGVEGEEGAKGDAKDGEEGAEEKKSDDGQSDSGKK